MFGCGTKMIGGSAAFPDDFFFLAVSSLLPLSVFLIFAEHEFNVVESIFGLLSSVGVDFGVSFGSGTRARFFDARIFFSNRVPLVDGRIFDDRIGAQQRGERVVLFLVVVDVIVVRVIFVRRTVGLEIRQFQIGFLHKRTLQMIEVHRNGLQQYVVVAIFVQTFEFSTVVLFAIVGNASCVIVCFLFFSAEKFSDIVLHIIEVLHGHKRKQTFENHWNHHHNDHIKEHVSSFEGIRYTHKMDTFHYIIGHDIVFYNRAIALFLF
mmetsp:Transcript_11819/g.25900  ORF Transcript_11819/g.25900 Transcript_11819/m.25900 type:complete len:264 (-) Transcript_11819:46-837(-)